MIDLQPCDLQKENVETSAEGLVRFVAAETNLGVLVGGDCGEGRLGEGESLENTPADAEQVICLDHMEARVVAMHGVQDDL